MTKSIVLTLVAVVMLNSFVFANKMVYVGGICFLEDDNGNRLKNTMYDLGPSIGTYFFGSDGSLCTGWYTDPVTDDAWFFVNNKTQNYGAMVFGFCYIDGYLRFFYPTNGKLAKADKGTKLDIVGMYDVDDKGFLYTKDGSLCRDTSEERSDYYVNVNYYDDTTLNNRTLAENGGITNYDGSLIGKASRDENQKSFRISNGAKAQLADKVTDKSNVIASKTIK